MALRHGVLPPTAHFSAEGSKLGPDPGPFRVLTSPEPWPRRPNGRPRRAAVSGFGFGGINAHALIEEWVPGAGEPTRVAPGWVDPEREAEPAPVAVVGLGAHFGPFQGLRAVQERMLGGNPGVGPEPTPHDWGVFESDWLCREQGSGDPPRGFHLDGLTLPLDRFRIPPKELAEMLPQQLLALLAAADATADAGWDDRPRPRAGVFVGIGLDPNTTNFHVRWTAAAKARAWSERIGLDLTGEDLDRWTQSLKEAAGPPLTANRTMGALGGLVASRIAREFRVGGPSFTVSSEETSGLRALEIGVRLLRQAEIDEAVVGAVDLTGDPRVSVASARAGVGALTRGDGAAALVLRRLDDALRDGDRVYAVIRGVGVASGGVIDPGTEDCLTAEAASERAGDESGIAPGPEVWRFASGPERIEVRTAAGPGPTDLGHTGASSGMDLLVKAALGLYQQILPPTPAVGPRYWLHDRADGPRRAEVRASGVDGTCVSVLLEEFTGAEPPATRVERIQPLGANGSALFAVEADDAGELVRGLDALSALARSHSGEHVETLARRWFAGRPNDPERRLGLAVVAGSADDLRDRLAEARRRVEGQGATPALRSEDRVHHSRTPLGSGAKVAFVYPGIGNHFAGMGRDLSARWPEVFRGLDAGTLRLRSQLAPGAGWDSAELPEFADQRAPILGQVVLGSAVSDLLRSLGVTPDAVIGYSLGESSALFATGAWADRDGMHARLDASPLFRTELAGPCDAARRAWGLGPGVPADWVAGVVPYPAETVREALAGIPRAYLLIVNTPRESVVGGRREAVGRLVETLGGLFVPLPLVSTVHCEIARQVEAEYRELHRLETTPPPGVRFYSAGWGRSYEPDRDSAAEAIVAQAVSTVDFPAVVRRAYDDGVRVFIEAGPGGSCSRMIRAILGDRPHLARPACVAGEDAVGTVLDLLARLIAERVRVDLVPLYGRESRAAAIASVVGRAPHAASTSEEDGVRGTPGTGLRRLPPNSPAAAGRHTIVVPVGGRPFDVPSPPAPSPNDRPEGPLAVSDAPRFVPSVSAVMASPISNHDTRAEPVTPSDPIALRVLATQTGQARAHESFLRASSRLAETMANHLAFQMSLVEALAASPAGLPQTEVPAREKPVGPPPVLDRDQCLEFAIGSVGKVLGPEFAGADAFPTRVRLPDEPLMLVDRIVTIEGEPLSMTSGRVVTEHDVKEGDWYLDGGKAPACIAIESGQADLFLSGYLGIDFITKGLAVYRLLDAAVVFHRELPRTGEVIRYDIKILRFFRQGDTHLFRFEFEGSIDGEPLLTMRDGCAGFFTEGELAAGRGVVHTALDLRPIPGKTTGGYRPLVPVGVESYDDWQVEALRSGDYAAAFGPAFEGLGLADPIRLPGGRMTLVHRIARLDPTGGRYGLGQIRSELDIHPDDWFLTCHFVDDQVMPGTLMYECCLHTLRVFLMRLGWVGESAGVAFEPVPGVASRLRCRGQVVGTTGKAVFELSIKELGYRPEPYAVADALMYADGKPIVEVVDMTLRLTGLTREAVERLWEGRAATGSAARSGPVFTREQVLAFALGRPSEAFGEPYRPFDEGRRIARLPAPPYSFLDRVMRAEAEPWVLRAGSSAEAEYDVAPDAWYFGAEGTGRMPFAVLQEVSLQACGWLSAYSGSALTDDEDLAFRNLGGEAELLAEVTPGSGTLTTRVTMTRVSRSGGMMIQNFDFETRAGDTPVYRGSTYFGFFRRAALADQVGIREATPYEPTADELARSRSFAYPREGAFPDDRLRMIDQIEAFVSDGGPHGLGYIEGTARVDPEAWFFQAHFYQDPVVPGSLGLESLLQLLKVVASERWGREFGPGGFGFATAGPGIGSHRWIYRGQVVPGDRVVTTRAVVTARDDARRLVRADGFLSVDGRVIYGMSGFSVRVVPRGSGSVLES
jgi:acyl transferase domain-containing protein/3-hydroxymyristoyl/3-hydroxydecanoyl-(acyl carrier protein) dehydratase